MQEISFNVLEDPFKFELIMLPCSCYQKKNGEVAVMTDSFLSNLVKKVPNLSIEMGKGVEVYGNCPSILSSIPNSPLPTKFATFPVTPSNLRAECPDDYVFNRLKGKFKKFSLLPGWALLPRLDMVEFSSRKLDEIIKYFKLSKIVIPFEAFTFDKEDEYCFTKIKNIMGKYLSHNVYIAYNIKVKENTQMVTSSSVTFEED